MTPRQRTRHENKGLRKLCSCARRKWAKCPHPWHFNFTHDGEHFRFSLERRVGRIVRTEDGQWKRERGTLGDRITSKTEALQEADRLRTGIRDGSLLQGPNKPVLATLTLGELLATYDRDYLAKERAASSLANARYQINTIRRTVVTMPDGLARPLGDCRVADITTGTIDQFKAVRRTVGLVATNRNLALLRACFNWAIRLGYLERTPFKRGTETVVRLIKELPRSRRLEPGEADRLLAACSPNLRAVVEAALETGCRKGELLSLQWHQVRFEPRAEIVLDATKTKTRRTRRVPISTRLRAILAMRRAGPDGVEHPPAAFVFGNEIGQRVKRFTRAWEAAVLRAHGYTPEYADAGARGLTPACRAQLRAINLHFHDLRREAGSRWLDGGVPLQVIRDWLGHTNISQTSTYLESTFAGQHEAMRQYEARLQTFASADEKGHQTGPLAEMTANRNTPEITQKHH